MGNKLIHERDRGIYLQPLGKVPPIDIIVNMIGDLPCDNGGSKNGNDNWNYNSYSNSGGDNSSKGTKGKNKSRGKNDNESNGRGKERASGGAVSDAVDIERCVEIVEQSGIMMADGELLKDALQRFRAEGVNVVVANANSIEPMLNGALALLECYQEDVYKGLGMVQRCLSVDRVVIAYPQHFRLRHKNEQGSDIECVAISDKYPYGRTNMVKKVIEQRGHKHWRTMQPGQIRAAVFDIQVLWQLGRVVTGVGNGDNRRGGVSDVVVTVAGDGVENPGHFRVAVGIALVKVLEQAGPKDDTVCILKGSSINGTAITEPEIFKIAANDCCFVVMQKEPYRPVQACIRCGWCIDNCPAWLDPAMLISYCEAGKVDEAKRAGISRCIECGICSYVCPSHLPIMEQVVAMKYS